MRQTAFRSITAVLGLCLLSGCASTPQWSHPSKTDVAERTDLRLCEREAERAALEAQGQSRGDLAGRTLETSDPMALKDRQVTTRLFEARRDACMRRLGYTKGAS